MMGFGLDIPTVATQRRAGPSGSAPFSPLDVSPTVFLDPSNLSSLYQDAGGGIPVSTDGQPVGLVQDQSNNGVDVSQATSAARPTYRTDGTLHWLETDGVDDTLVSAPVLDVANPVTMVIGYQIITATGSSRVNLAEISKSPTNGISAGIRPGIDRFQYYSRLSDEGVSATNLAGTTWGGHTPHVITVLATSGNIEARLDGNVVLNTSQNLTSQSVSNQPLRVGLGAVTASIPGAFKLFGLQVWSAGSTQPTAIELAELESWMAAKMGVST